MDHDIMWQQFLKYRPMLEEAYEGWSKSKEQEELERRKTLDGRPLSDEEIAANDAGQAGGRALPGHYVREGAHPQPVEPKTLEPGSDEELDRLREMAEDEGIDYEDDWDAKKFKQELDMDEDEPVKEKVEEPPPPSQGQPGAPGTGATASGVGGQHNDPNAGASTGSGTPHANPASLGATASGVGGQNNALSPEEQALIREEGLVVQAEPEQTAEARAEAEKAGEQAGAEQASDFPKASERSKVTIEDEKQPGEQTQVGEQRAGARVRRERGATQGGNDAHIQDGSSVQGQGNVETEGSTRTKVK